MAGKISSLDLLKHRNDPSLLPIPEIGRIKQRLTMQEVKNVSAQSLEDLSLNIGAVGLGTSQTDASGNALHTVYNDVGIFDAINFEHLFEENVLGDANSVELTFDGHVFQNTGSNQNLFMKLYMGAVGSEVQIDSAQAISIPSSSLTRAFRYVARISQAPNLGANIRVNEYFTMENTSTGAAIVLMRNTVTNDPSITSIAESVSLLFYPNYSGAVGTFRFYSDAVQIRVYDGQPAEKRHWHSGKAHIVDTYIRSDAATTNYGNNASISIGEINSAASTRRTLLKFNDLTNIPKNAIIKNAWIYIVTESDLSSNARTMEVYPILRNWTEGNGTAGSGADWNTFDGLNNWGTAGCGNSSTDYNGSVVLGSKSLTATEVVNTAIYIALDATELEKFVDGTYLNYGFLLKMQTESNDGYNYYSSENTTADEYSPMLHVIYEIPN